jgi:uncharacterized protein (TIGR02284 family)
MVFYPFEKISFMESKNETLTEALKALIRINNERTDGYEKAIIECKGNFGDLRILFTEMADQSRAYSNELKTKVLELEGDIQAGNADGSVSQIWNDVKWAYTGIDRDGILTSCAESEEEVQKAYDEVLQSEAEMGSATRQIIIAQKEALADSASRVKNARNLRSELAG